LSWWILAGAVLLAAALVIAGYLFKDQLNGNGTAIWQWIERTSWLVTIAGVFVLLGTLWLLLQEQRRIATEISRRPRIKLGLVIPGHPPENMEPSQTFLHQASTEPQLEIRFGVLNEGERTAVGLLHELIFPASVAEASSPDGRGFADGSGLVHLSWNSEDLHPRSGITHYAFVVLRPNIARVVVRATATFHDSAKVETEIEVVLQRVA
jgi:hypothetical protein